MFLLRQHYIADTPMKPTIHRPTGSAEAPRTSRARSTAPLLPHERDEFVGEVAADPDPQIAQAKKDLDAGMVDTDMWATPGLDAALREDLVPGPGGKTVQLKDKKRNP